MRRAAGSATLATALLGAAACASVAPPATRGDVIRQALASTVQLRVERAGGRSAGSGVVVASVTAPARSWILTTGHLLKGGNERVQVVVPGSRRELVAAVTSTSAEPDLAVLELAGVALPAVRVRETVRLGDEVWVVGFPWGRRFTVVSGVVSQVEAGPTELDVDGPARMVDASVSYGVSGGGVFDAASGALVAVVEGYRTAQLAVSDRVVSVPVPGETIVISGRVLIEFLRARGVVVVPAE